MAIVESTVAAPREDVFAVLADGWTYSDWVVGTAHIRAVDADWPKPGAVLHHKAGPWPVSVRDRTVSVRCEPPSLLVMSPHLWPLGEATVTITLEEVEPGRTLVGIHEDFERGPLRWLRTRVNDLALHYRNRESLRRLGDLARRRADPREGETATNSPRPSDVRRQVR
jgi:uncharacterized protein YndB with AHSA1/START domain